MAEDTNFKTGDSLWALTRKILARLNQGISTSGGGGGGGGGGAVTIADGTASGGAAVVGNALTIGGNLATVSNVSVVNDGHLSSIASITNPVTVAQATAANLKVDLSGTGANATALKVDGSAVTQPVSGNVGGKTFVLKVNPTISTSVYVAGNTIGAIQTLTNAVTVSSGTGILESLILLDKSNQKAPMDIFIFESNPAAATTTDHAAFVFSTDNLKVIARVSVTAGDYVTVNSNAIAIKTGLGIAVKANGSANLYAVAVTSSTPTYAGANDLQWVWGILQD